MSLLGRNRTLKGNGGLHRVRDCQGLDRLNTHLIAESTYLMSSSVMVLSTGSSSNAQKSAAAMQRPVSSAKYRPGQTLGAPSVPISNDPGSETLTKTHRRPYPNTTEGSGRSFGDGARNRSGLNTPGESQIRGSRSINLELSLHQYQWQSTYLILLFTLCL